MKTADLPSIFSEERMRSSTPLALLREKSDPRILSARVVRDMEAVDSKGGGGAHASPGSDN